MSRYCNFADMPILASADMADTADFGKLRFPAPPADISVSAYRQLFSLPILILQILKKVLICRYFRYQYRPIPTDDPIAGLSQLYMQKIPFRDGNFVYENEAMTFPFQRIEGQLTDLHSLPLTLQCHACTCTLLLKRNRHQSAF